MRRALAGVGSVTPPFEGVTGTVAFDANGDVPNQNVYIGLVQRGAVEVVNGADAAGGHPMRLLRSLRHRVIAQMALLSALVFGIALLGVNSIRALDRSVKHEISLLLESTDLGNGLVSSVPSEIRSAEQYLARPDRAAPDADDRGGRLGLRLSSAATARSASLTTADRYIVNKIASNQAQIEVAYGMAHALTDLGRIDEARRMADRARAPVRHAARATCGRSGLAQTTRSVGARGGSAPAGGQPAERALGAVLRIAAAGRAHRRSGPCARSTGR